MFTKEFLCPLRLKAAKDHSVVMIVAEQEVDGGVAKVADTVKNDSYVHGWSNKFGMTVVITL